MRTAIDRFLEKVNKTDTCWLWTAQISKQGYGRFYVGPENARTRIVQAHRWSYEYFVGPIPDGLEIDHVKARGCVHKHCVNPAHLEPVTHRENDLRGTGVSAVNVLKTHCPQGHPYDEANTYTYTRPGQTRRNCRACGRAVSRRRRAA